jgi:lysophospholipase L1-like esterase
LADGDRVVLLGGGFIEQQRLHCYLETRLLRHHPRGGQSFRNLGWGGDTVRGAARTGGLGNPEGFARLLKEVKEWAPTVIFVGYGMNESFAGARGLDAFIKDYDALLDKLAPLKARLILLSPTHHEPLPPPHPDASAHNEDLKAYTEALRTLARQRNLDFIDLFEAMKKAKDAAPDRLFTTNGILPNAAGYALISRTVETALGYSNQDGWRVALSANGKVTESVGAKATVETSNLSIRVAIRPEKLAIADALGQPDNFLKVTDLPAGMHVLKAGGKEILRAAAGGWARGVSLPAADNAAEKLRQALVVNSDLFYRRWRPFNDHSRHVEFLKDDFSLYDKAIAEQERAIQALLTPRPSSIEIVPLGNNQ